jgi:hypothetical protein
MGSAVGMISVDLPYGGEATIDDARLNKLPLAEARMKGGFVDFEPRTLLAEGAYSTQQLDGTGGRFEGDLAFRCVWGQRWAAVSLGSGGARFRGEAITAHELDATVSLSAGYRWPGVPFTFYLGGVVDSTLVRQSFVRDDEQTFLQITGQSLPVQWVWGASAGGTGAIEIPLTQRWLALVTFDALVRYLPTSDQSAWTVGMRVRAGVGARF